MVVFAKQKTVRTAPLPTVGPAATASILNVAISASAGRYPYRYLVLFINVPYTILVPYLSTIIDTEDRYYYLISDIGRSYFMFTDRISD
jgi:hypothetical protein